MTPADLLWQLIFANDPAEIARREAELSITQTGAIDNFIEESCWSEQLPALVGRRGTAEERKAVLRAAYVRDHGAAPPCKLCSGVTAAPRMTLYYRYAALPTRC